MLGLDRKYLVMMMEAGYIYLGMQRFEEAKKLFEGLTVLAPESELPHVALGSVAFCSGDFKEALKAYQQALEIDPQSHFARVYSGEALFFIGKKKEAIACLEAVSREDNRGAAGDFAKALLNAIQKGFTPKQLTEERKHASPSMVH